jgi:hypothetical protein
LARAPPILAAILLGLDDYETVNNPHPLGERAAPAILAERDEHPPGEGEDERPREQTR